MDITEIDKNLRSTTVQETDVVWRNVRDEAFSLHGVFYSEEEKAYRRMSKAVADKVSDGVAYLSKNTAGGRVRFVTDSPYIAIKALMPAAGCGSNMSLGSQSGFAVYADGVFEGNPRPEFSDATDGKYAFARSVQARTGGMRNIELYFPLYNGVNELYIGLKEGCRLEKAKPYPDQVPVVFYGSSITQGGCASHAGNDYVSLLSRRLDFDFVNLGFSGSAKGEAVMADYLAALKAKVMVLDYDFNSPTVETLQETHYPLYEKIRKAQPNVPILFMTRPNFLYDPSACKPRREVIYQTYLRAKEQGDRNVAFVDGENLLGQEDWDICTVDNCHPNDMGFYRMANAVYPVLKELLGKG